MAEYEADVLVDMGHYTGYNKSPVVPGYSEGNQMWILGNYLIEELHALGRTTKTTRRNRDENPSVTARGRMAAGCKLAISEHSNAGGLGRTDRAVGICMVDDDCGPIDELSRELARRLAETDREEMRLLDAYQVYERRSGKDRDGDGLKNDDYYGFLYGAHQVGTAAVIIENGFHDHRHTAKWLLIDSNLRRLAKAHADVIDEFLREHFDKEDEDMIKTPMKPGDKGENVRQLQGILRLAGYYDGKLDGSYGPKTTEAVTAFQAANGLEKDGKAGPKTLEVLLSFKFQSAKGQPMQLLQVQRYDSVEELPAWAQEIIGDLVDRKIIRGDELGRLDLSEDMVRTMMFVYRMVPDRVWRPAEPPEPEIIS